MSKQTKNQNLHIAKKYKNDEFYTQYEDIEAELRHYKEHFRDKVVYCNCDDPLVSNFPWYFVKNYDQLKFKKVNVYDTETKLVHFRNVRWFTNLEYNKRHQDIDLLTKSYNESRGIVYHKYDNYAALNVDKTAEIPSDYSGIMGVPITFLDKWNPNQFEILGAEQYDIPDEMVITDNKQKLSVNGSLPYKRIYIKHLHPKKYRKSNKIIHNVEKYFQLQRCNARNII